LPPSCATGAYLAPLLDSACVMSANGETAGE